ncbi:amidase domain-containing protein [Tessaracoccus sp. O5.2]|uniref:amidase domain-containing protein n=1 Tax=Tessaracoccus sp. O5.2 TaxID=3157622 RepID=UPI0036DE10A3
MKLAILAAISLVTISLVATNAPKAAHAETLPPPRDLVDQLAPLIEEAWEQSPTTQQSMREGLPSTIADDVVQARQNYELAGYRVVDAEIVPSGLPDGIWQISTTLTLEDSAGTSEAGWSEYYRFDESLGSVNVSTVSDEEAMSSRPGTRSETESRDALAWQPAVGRSSAVRSEASEVADRDKADLSGSSTASRALPSLNYYAMRDYALEWTTSDNLSEWYGDAGNNCANFASQVLNAGGWPAHRDYICSSSSFDNWTHKNNASPCLFLSRYSDTWSRSHTQQSWMIQRGGKWRLPNIWEARLADYLYVDWDPNNVPDGKIDHVMIVTGHSSTNEPRISQKSSNRHNILLSESIRIAQSQGKSTIHWYGLIT